MAQNYTALPDASAPPGYESVANASPPGGAVTQAPPQPVTLAASTPVVVVADAGAAGAGAGANPNAVLKQFAGAPAMQQQQQQPQATYAIMPQQPVVYYQQTQPPQALGAAPQQPAMARDGQAGAAAAATQYPGQYQYQPPQYAPQQQQQGGYPGQYAPQPQFAGQPPQQYPGMAAGGAGGAAMGGGMPVAQPQQTVVYASGAPLPMYFTHQSQLVICPVCRAQAPTMVEYEPGLGTWAICCGLACVGCWVGCCLIPFCVPECQDATHRCPHCKNVVGRKALLS